MLSERLVLLPSTYPAAQLIDSIKASVSVWKCLIYLEFRWQIVIQHIPVNILRVPLVDCNTAYTCSVQVKFWLKYTSSSFIVDSRWMDLPSSLIK